jgi:hypothetical protein
MSGNGQILVRITAENADFITKAAAVKASVEAMGASMEIVERKGKRAKDSAKGLLDMTGADLGKTAMQFAKVGTALAVLQTTASTLLGALENSVQRAQAAGNTATNLADPERNLFANLGGEISAKDATRLYRELARTKGVSPTKVIPLMAAAFSNTAGRTRQDVLDEEVNAILDYMPDAPAERQQEAISGLLAYTNTFKVPAREALGSGLAAASESRAPNPSVFFKKGFTAAARLKQFGWDKHESLALISGLSVGAQDEELDITASSAVNAARQLQEAAAGAMPEIKNEPEKIIEVVRSKTEIGGRMRARFFGAMAKEFGKGDRQVEMAINKFLDKKLGIAELGKFTNEAKTIAYWYGMLDPNSEVDFYKQYHEIFKKKIPTGRAAGEFTTTKIAESQASPIQQAERMKQRQVTGKELEQTGDAGLYAKGVASEQIEAAMQHITTDPVRRWTSRKMYGLFGTTKNPVEVSREAYETVEKAARRNRFMPVQKGDPNFEIVEQFRIAHETLKEQAERTGNYSPPDFSPEQMREVYEVAKDKVSRMNLGYGGWGKNKALPGTTWDEPNLPGTTWDPIYEDDLEDETDKPTLPPPPPAQQKPRRRSFKDRRNDLKATEKDSRGPSPKDGAALNSRVEVVITDPIGRELTRTSAPFLPIQDLG